MKTWRRVDSNGTVGLLALIGLAVASCGGGSAAKTVTVEVTKTLTTPATTTAPQAKPEATGRRLLPRFDGFWRVVYIPVNTNQAQATIRRYWQILPLCKRGACSFRVLSRTTPHGRVHARIAFRFDPAIGEYRYTEHGREDCANPATGRVIVVGGYSFTRQLRISVATARRRRGERIATRAGGRDVYVFRETPAAATQNCRYAPNEQYRVVMVRLGFKALEARRRT